MRTDLHPLTRRRFLAWSGVAAAGLLTCGAGVLRVDDLLADLGSPSAGPVLVIVTLYGGNDGLNTVIPAGDPAYQDGRPQLAYAPHEVLDLGDGLGLNPGMPKLHALWRNDRLGIVRGVGYPRPDRSHFRSMAIWQTASPETSVKAGWLGRWLDKTGQDPMRAISLEPTLPPFLAGELAAGSTIQPTGLTLPARAAHAAYQALGRSDPADSPFAARVAASITDTFNVAAVVNQALTPPPTGKGQLGKQLAAVAALINAGASTRVYSVSLGGFDTHANERGTQQALLSDLDSALGEFADTTVASPRQVVTIVYSEFGRRVRANNSHGTDHGTASPMFVLGNGIRTGFQGEQPSLTDLDAGDLKFTVDFRDVYASILEEVVGIDAETVLGDWQGRIPLVS